jgi:hypothetical protein
VYEGQAARGHFLREVICLATIVLSWLIAVTVQADPLIRLCLKTPYLASRGFFSGIGILRQTPANAIPRVSRPRASPRRKSSLGFIIDRSSHAPGALPGLDP